MWESIKKFFLNSSEDPNKLSLTLQGIMGSVVSFITLIVALHGGTPISAETQSLIVQNATITIASIGTAIGAMTTLFGLIRKAFNQFKPWNSPQE